MNDRARLDRAARIALVVRSCPLVLGLHSGDHGAIVTSTGSGELLGVLVTSNAIVIGVIGSPRTDLDSVVEQVRRAVAVLALTAMVSVSVIVSADPDPDTARRLLS